MNLTATLSHELKHFDETMGQYIALSRRTPAEVVAQKGAQIILGNRSPYFPGLYQALRDLSPAESSITRGRLSALASTPRGANRPVKVRRRARQRAEDLLAGRPSGLFSVTSRNGGRLAVRQVRYAKRGNKRISNRANRGGVVRINRRSDATGGSDKLLNRISLGIALELMIREQGRGYTAISFLPKKYRGMLGRARAATRRDAQAYKQRKVDMNKALTESVQSLTEDTVMRNAKGAPLGRVSFATSGAGAALRITGFTPPQARAEAQARVTDVLRYVSADTKVYIDKKLSRTRKEVGRFGGN